jgi:hypothetical protein
MAQKCTVDAELFDSLKDAIDFVAERGGGVVHTELAGTMFAKSLKLPGDVQLQPPSGADGELATVAGQPQRGAA